jgi:glycosyltransferase involved in cell wall biosynthesis
MDSISAKISVIVPAHNEEDRIEATLRDLRSALPEAKIVVVVNDSFDRTLGIVGALAATDSHLILIDVPARVGKGGAVRIGFGLADRPYVAFVDADGATSGHEVARLASLLDHCDCVVASRWMGGSQIAARQSAFRRILGRGFNTCVRVLFGLRLWDTQCGAKLFRHETLLEILDDVETADFAFDVDLLYAAHRRGHRIREVPTVWRERAGSKVDVRSAVPRMFLSLLRLRLRHSVLRIVLPLFDRYLRLAPIRSRRSLRYLVFAPSDGRSAAATPLEREMRRVFDEIASSACDITWFAVDAQGPRIPGPRWVRAMFAYLRSFRDRFDCVVEVLPGRESFLTPPVRCRCSTARHSSCRQARRRLGANSRTRCCWR